MILPAGRKSPQLQSASTGQVGDTSSKQQQHNLWMTLWQMECPNENLFPTTDMKKKWKTAAKQQQTGCCSGDFCKTTKIQTLHKHKGLKNKTNTRKTQRQNFCNPTTEKPRWVQWRDQRATIGRLARSHRGKCSCSCWWWWMWQLCLYNVGVEDAFKVGLWKRMRVMLILMLMMMTAVFIQCWWGWCW